MLKLGNSLQNLIVTLPVGGGLLEDPLKLLLARTPLLLGQVEVAHEGPRVRVLVDELPKSKVLITPRSQLSSLVAVLSFKTKITNGNFEGGKFKCLIRIGLVMNITQVPKKIVLCFKICLPLNFHL